MKRLALIIALTTLSVSAFAQFPLGDNKENIKTFFASNVPYAMSQEYKTKAGAEALNFTKVRVVGDYTFYFNDQDVCTSYTETYDTKEMDQLIWRLDRKFCRLTDNTWEGEEQGFRVTLQMPKKGANYISVIYKPIPQQPVVTPVNTLAAN